MVDTKRVGQKVKMSLFLILSGFQKRKRNAKNMCEMISAILKEIQNFRVISNNVLWRILELSADELCES